MKKSISNIKGVKILSKSEQNLTLGGFETNCRTTGSISTSGFITNNIYTTVTYRCGGDEFGEGYTIYAYYINGVYDSHKTLYEA